MHNSLRPSDKEINNMNKGKVGAPFDFKTEFKISYRTVQGILRTPSDYLRIHLKRFILDRLVGKS
jgi:hypothetical protein